MASTYTSNTGIEKPGDGEQSGTWGTTVNTNSDILDRALNGVLTLSLIGTSTNLTTTDGTLSNGQYKLISFTGSPSGTHTVNVLPNDSQKIYFLNNTTNETVIISQGSGASVTLPAGESDVIYCDGGGVAAAVVDLSANFNVSMHLESANNLSDLASAPAAILNLGINATAGELNYNNLDQPLGISSAERVVTADADGDVSLSEELKAKSYNETFSVVSSSSGTLTIDFETGNVFQSTLTENVTTLTLSNPPATGTSYSFTLKIVQDSTARTITWPSSVDWAAATAPTISTGSGEVDVFVFFTTDGGTTFYGFTAGQVLS
tara:strand:- start:1378 stop:2337 length:960 start_codon:yes stop_codon:yes gene_type:complete